MVAVASDRVVVDFVRDRLIDGGLDLDDPIEQMTLESPSIKKWETHTPSGAAEQALFTHQVTEDVVHQLINPERWGQTTLYLGKSAIGKTQAIEEGIRRAAKLMGRASILDIVHLSQMSLVDALGVPRMSFTEDQMRDGQVERHHAATYFALPEMWPTVDREPNHARGADALLYHLRQTGEVDWSGVEDYPLRTVFLDELTNPSSEEVVHQFFPLILDRRMGGRKMVADYAVIAAGNRIEDGCNSVELSVSAVTRMAIKEVVPNFPGWVRWAMEPRFPGSPQWRIHPLIVSFLWQFNEYFAPNYHDAAPMVPFPSPRAWDFVSTDLYVAERSKTPDSLLKPQIAGRVGPSVAAQFFGYLKLYRDLPDVQGLMRGQEIAWPSRDRFDIYLMIGTQMVKLLDETNYDRFMDVILTEKFSPEMTLMIVKMLRPAGKLQRIYADKEAPGFARWRDDFTQLFKRYSRMNGR